MPGGRGTLAQAQHAFRDTFVPAHRDRIRVVATDVDGTLTNHDGRLRPVALEALAHLRDRPDPPTLVLVTGRPAAAVQALLLYTGFADCPIVAENGAVVLARPGAHATILAPFKAAHAQAVQACLAQASCGARLAEDNADHLSDMTFVPDAPGSPTPAALTRLAHEITCALRDAPPECALPPTQVLHSTIHVHVGAAGVDKGRTLQLLLAGQTPGIPAAPVPAESVVCLGDSANDAALFTTFPEQAVAVPGPGPALHPGLVEVARYAAPAVADEGFAAVVRALFSAP